MEKIVCALWSGDVGREAFNAGLISALPAALHLAGASHIRLNLRDASVDPGTALIQRWQEPQQDAVLQFWLPSANAIFRAEIDRLIANHCDHFAAWLVAESSIIANRQHPPVSGERTWGWSQASFINFRDDLAHGEAVEIWHSHHTRVAIDTQSNFEYVQNLIVRPLTEGAPTYSAFVEECFPISALTDPQAFFDAVGDRAKFEANLGAMMESCGRFIQFGRIDIMPTSQYDFG
ncbi:MAG: EthD domain-containing protein [Sphingomonadaceae bacterium]